jgi:glycine/D-amino acid oxidase-like deaminating enzyme
MNIAPQYDIVIIGAGIAGLYCGLDLIKRGHRVHIIEKYTYIGGRITTYHKKLEGGVVSWENGAGRIHSSHRMVRALLKRYGIRTDPISDKMDYIGAGAQHSSAACWEELAQVFLQPLLQLPAQELAQHTVYSLCKKIHGLQLTQEFIHRHPYYTEIHVMRADLALKQLLGELGSRSGYMVCRGGLSQLINAMAADFKKRGGTIETGVECFNVEVGTVHTSRGPIHGNKIICALHVNALRKLPLFASNPILRHLRMMPLLRIYMVFPKVKGVVWFSNMNKVVTPGKLRYIIPIDVEKGSIMVSYTDGADTNSWMWGAGYDASNAVKARLTAELLRELRALFGEIPEPLFMKAHPWYDGATAWLPGSYDAAKMSEAICNGPKIYVCGESYSLRQAWMEGALEHASLMLTKM